MLQLAFLFGCIWWGTLNCQAFRFAWLTDTHVTTESGEAAQDLQAAVRDINAMTNVDFVLVSGDVTSLGWLDQFTAAKRLLDQLKVPCHVIPGNHDCKWSESGGLDFPRFWGADRFVFDFGKFTFIGLHEGPLLRTAEGHWAPQDLRWLDEVLKKVPRTRPLIFVTHYPLDPSIDNWYEVLDRLKTHNTQVSLCGHGHANGIFSFEGVPGVMARSTLRDDQEIGGYTLVDVTATEMRFSERTTGRSTGAPWHTLALGQRHYVVDTNNYPRPSYSVNTNYPAVRELWQFASSNLITAGPAVWNDTGLIGDSTGMLYALDLADGKPRWNFKAGGPILGTPDLEGDTVFFAAADGVVYALDARNGKKLWQTEPMSRPIVSCVRAANGKVFVGGSDHTFRAFEASSGKELWSFKGLHGFVETRPLVQGNKVIFGAWDANLYALNDATGDLIWKWAGSGVGTSPAACWPVAANGRVFVAAPDRSLSAIDLESGKLVWRTKAWQPRESVGLSEDGSRLYARMMWDIVAAFATAAPQPEPVWELNAGFGYDFNPAQLVEKQGIVFCSTKNGLLLAVDGKTGRLVWKHKLCHTLVHTPVPLSASRVLVSDFDGRVTLLDDSPAAK